MAEHNVIVTLYTFDWNARHIKVENPQEAPKYILAMILRILRACTVGSHLMIFFHLLERRLTEHI